MAEVTQNGFEITEFRFLKPSCWLIKYHGKAPIVSRRDHISLILVHTVSIFHVDDSTNLFFKSGEHGKSYAAFIPTTSRYCEVKKHADADSGSDNSADQSANYNNANGNNTDAVHQNYAAPCTEIVPAEDSGGSDGGDDGNKDGGNGDNDGRVEQRRPIRVHRIGVSITGARTSLPIINTKFVASQFDSWEAFALAISSVWEATDGEGREYHVSPLKKLTRYTCWPKGVTSFGRFDEEGRFIQYYCDRDEWEEVKMLITDVKVLKYYSGLDEKNQDSREAEEDEAYYRRPLWVRILCHAAYLCFLVFLVMLVAALVLFLDVLWNRVIEYFHDK